MSATKIILKFGHRSYILPASVNVNTLIKSLSGAMEADDNYHDGDYYYTPTEAVKIEIILVDAKFVIDPKRKRIPEKAGPECMGEMV
jgi:hypothetical protein